MYKLPPETRALILTMLCEGSSMRSVSRVCGVSINTVTKLLVDAGTACAAFHDEKVRSVAAKAVQCDEIWAFSYAKKKNVKFAKSAPEGAGDVWTWTAIDADSKLIVSWHVGDRSQHTGIAFMGDLKGRLANRVQLTTDGHKAYLKAVEVVDFDADYAMLEQDFRDRCARTGPLQPAEMHRRDQATDLRQSRSGAYQYVICRAAEPDDADGNAPVYAADQCVFQEIREPLPRAGALFLLVQLGSQSQDAGGNSGNGGWPHSNAR